jgi:AraC-like DNA-binding protein
VKYRDIHGVDRTVRVGPLCNIESLLYSLEFEPRPIFAAAGWSPEDLHDPNHPLPYAKAVRLLEHCAEASQCDHFGLLLGQRFLLAQLGIAGQLASTAADVASALHDIVSDFQLHDQGGIATLDSASRYSAFGYTIIDPQVTALEQVYDLSISCMCGAMRSFCGMDWNPARIEFSRAQPLDPRPYEQYFRAPVVFGAAKNAVIFSNRWLGHVLITANPDYHQRLAQDAQALLNAAPFGLSQQVRQALHQRLTLGENRAAAVATALGLHERTLRRRLRLEGTSFRELLEEARQAASCQYLAGTSLSIKAIAIALGYRSTDAFDHAFKRWFGCSPLAWRQSRASREPAKPRPGLG